VYYKGSSKRGILIDISYLLHFPYVKPLNFDLYYNDITVFWFVFKILYSSIHCIL